MAAISLEGHLYFLAHLNLFLKLGPQGFQRIYVIPQVPTYLW